MLATSTIIAAVGLAIGAAGAVTNYIGAQQAASAQQKQEKLRKQQMNLDVMRRRRELIRQMLIQRALGISNATNQGAVASDSAVQGGIAQATQTANVGSMDLNQNAQLGTQMFQANAQEASGRGIAAMGTAMGSWGSGLVQNSTTISRVGQSFGLWQSSYGGA